MEKQIKKKKQLLWLFQHMTCFDPYSPALWNETSVAENSATSPMPSENCASDI